MSTEADVLTKSRLFWAGISGIILGYTIFVPFRWLGYLFLLVWLVWLVRDSLLGEKR